MDKYEISLWEDYPDLTSSDIPFLNERKICVIGSNTMTSAARALEPKLISNVNGTNTFSFRIYYRYKDEITGEEYINPYLSYIINERKVKVLWKDKWYDLVIKKIEEDTQKRSILCTCEDLFISELSKNGYELEFNSELQNNSGTAEELMEKVLDGSGWQPAAEQQSIIQYQEEPVYEVRTQRSINVTKQSPSGDTSAIIPADKLCLLYQSCIDEDCVNIQFLYSENGYATEDNNMLVLNGDCYTFTGKVTYSGDQASIIDSSNNVIFQFTLSNSFSSNYRAKRLVNTQLTAFDELLGRYVDVYENDIYGYETTEYSDPTLVVNLIANPKDFKDTKGWIGNDLMWEVYPAFTGQSQVVNYNAKSYLKVSNGDTYNTALVSNKQYLTPNSADIKNGILGGFQIGEKYIFRYKAKSSKDSQNYISSKINGISGNIYEINNNYTKKGQPYFQVESSNTNNGWVENELKCTKTCTANDLDSVGFFINANSTYFIEDIQFFKLAYGIDSYDSSIIKRMNPGEISLQSIATVVYRYYNADHGDVTDAKDLEFLYQGTTKSNNYIPKYNNYEKVTSIEESKSNRFNILQSIAEKFQCWVRFIINHDENGRVLYDNQGLPQKYVQLVEQIGNDTGISFEYGIDLKGIKRTIVSNTIASKAIIIPNENEFGKHGFCTIARSPLNYCRENFILNFDYYIQQGLLNKDALEADLYKTNGRNLGYFFYLNKFNKQYDSIADAINIKQIELTKQKAEYKVQFGNYQAALEKLGINKADLMSLANVNTFSGAQSYASTHPTNRKVQSLMGSIAQLNNNIQEFEQNIPRLKNSIDVLEAYINEQIDIMNQLVQNVENLHKAFFKKYSRFIQEGTWQDQNYVNDDDYYLDALEVAYRSSRPQIQYDISLLRLSGLEDFSSKIFDLGDICYIQDKEFFGYEEDGITPYKQRIIISQLTSYFDTPEKDVIKVQNYKTQFDDLFQRITTATQTLQFSQGRYERAAGVVKPDGTLSFGLLQDTFDYNKDLIINSANQEVTWDNTGITVSDSTNSALKVKIMAGGIFASDDGGDTWKNALRGDGISTDLLTAGRINTSEVFVYDGNHQSFRWDSQGINAYTSNLVTDGNGQIREYPFSKFVRFDRFGIYGYQGTEDFEPSDEEDIWTSDKTKFGLTWKGFFLRNASGNSSIEISNENDILIKTNDINRIQIGKYDNDYGMRICDANGNNIFNVSTTNNTNSIGGWALTKNSLYHTTNNNTIGLYSNGKSETINGISDTYYILAGNNFGVTIDGGVYASKGKIGDCEIVNGRLTIGSGNTQQNLVDAISGTISAYSSETQYYLSNSKNKLSGGSWSSSLPDSVNNKYVWTRTKTITTTASGTTSTTYKPSEGGVYSQSLTEMLQGAKASTAVYRTQTIFRSIGTNDSLPTTGPTDWVNETAVTITDPNNSGSTISSGPQGKWTQIRPIYNSNYPTLYIATQTQTIKQYEDKATGTEGKCSCTQPHLEVTTTVIDGAHITTGKIDAQRINVSDLSAFGATIGGFTIGQSAIYSNGKNSYNSVGTGVYIGSDGIKLGNNFSVNSNGELSASSGTFTGTVRAGGILYGGDNGYFNGSGIDNYTIPGTAIANGAIGTNALTTGVTTSLGYANNFNNATTQNGSYPDYFRAGTLVGVNSISCGGSITGLLRGTSIKVTPSDSDGEEIELATHSHTISFEEKNDGKIELTIGSPSKNLTNKASFKIADTTYFSAQVSAAREAGANTVYVRTWRFYKGSYPYNNNKNKIGITGSVWLAGKNTDGSDLELTNSRNDSDEDDYSIDISEAVVASITRRTNLANNQPMPDTWNSNTNKGQIYVTAKNSAGASLFDATIEVTTSSAIYQAGAASVTPASSVTISTITNIANPGTWDFTPSATDSDNIVYGTTQKTIQSYFNIKLSNNNKYSMRVTIDATKAYNTGYNAGVDKGAETAKVSSVSITSNDTHVQTSAHHYINTTVKATAKATYSNGSTYTAKEQTISSNRNIVADAVWDAGVASVTLSQVKSITYTGEYDYQATIARAKTNYYNNYLYGYINIKLSNGNVYTTEIAMHGGEAYDQGYSDGGGSSGGTILDQAYNMGYNAGRNGEYESVADARRAANSLSQEIVNSYVDGYAAGAGY